jgi:DNA-binding protein HU-beta
MNRNDLIDELAESSERSRIEAEQVLDAVLTHIAAALERGEKVDIRGFGAFQVIEKKERQGRNPKTGETLTIAAKKVASFKPSKDLAERVNRKAGAASAGSASPETR